MMRFLQPLWQFLTTGKDSDLRQMIEYLKEENKILRSKLPERITVSLIPVPANQVATRPPHHVCGRKIADVEPGWIRAELGMNLRGRP